MADWSLLPRDLLERIICCFETCFEIAHFRSVCSSWRLAVPPPNHSRRSFIPFFSGNRRRFDGLTHCKLKKIPVSLLRFQTPIGADCFIVAISERKSGKQKLISPLASNKFASWRVLNTLTTQTIFLGHSYEISFYSCTSPNRYTRWREKVDHVGQVAFLQLNCRDFAVITEVVGVLMMYTSRDKKWTEIKGQFQGLQHLVSFKGKFYVVDRSGRGHVFVIDPSLEVTQIRSVVQLGQCVLERLVVSGDELLLVQRFTSRAHGDENNDTCFSLFRLKEEGQRRWVRIYDLEDRVVFLGFDWNLCYPAKELPGMKGNCIVFVEEPTTSSESIRVFDFITRKTSDAFTECKGYMGAEL